VTLIKHTHTFKYFIIVLAIEPHTNIILCRTFTDSFTWICHRVRACAAITYCLLAIIHSLTAIDQLNKRFNSNNNNCYRYFQIPSVPYGLTRCRRCWWCSIFRFFFFFLVGRESLTTDSTLDSDARCNFIFISSFGLPTYLRTCDKNAPIFTISTSA